jgi:hypothetical protein
MNKVNTALVIRTKALAWTTPLFQELGALTEKYVELENETPYWNNETASASMLVSAAWYSGGIGLSDYRVTKAGNVNGRCDAYVGLKNHYLEIEAKQEFFNLVKRAKTLSTRLESACADARRLRRIKGVLRAGVLFATPVVPVSRWDDLWGPSGPFERFGEVDADLRWYWYDQRRPIAKSGFHYSGVEVFLKLVT